MKRFITVFLFVAGADIFALDAQFAKIVNTTITDIKTKTDLPSLKGHVSVTVSSGNGDLDKQFLAAILESFPNFTATSESVDEEDVYTMLVRVFRTAGTVTVSVIVTDHQDTKTVDRRIPIGTVDNKLLPTIRYESEIRARTEFDAFLDAAFADLGPPQNANYTPKEPYDWSWLTNFFSRVTGFFVDGYHGFVDGLDPAGAELYLFTGGYSFTEERFWGTLGSGGITFENGVGIATDIYRMHGSNEDGSVSFFPIDVSWTFLEVWGFRLAVYDRLGLFTFEMPSEEWTVSNAIGLRMNRMFGHDTSGVLWGTNLGLFAETDFKTFSLGIATGLGWAGGFNGFADGFKGSFSNFDGGFKIKKVEYYILKGGYSFTDNSVRLDLISGGIFFENGVGISTGIESVNLKTGYITLFPIDVSWTFMEVWGFPLAVYDRIGFLAARSDSERWTPSNYIGLRLHKFLGYYDDIWNLGADLGVFMETDFKTFSLGISAGLGGGWFF